MILAIYNPKGGCGKTTTAVNLAAELARRGRSVLLVDLEADMGASISLGVRPGEKHPSIFELLLNQRRPTEAVRPV
ncbi:MAG TPA: AAA family ATPase, partial [Ilumatobacteraceae bacterium]|nr:AAA family ATPase [Ilumatobacteraceae bacterium]